MPHGRVPVPSRSPVPRRGATPGATPRQRVKPRSIVSGVRRRPWWSPRCSPSPDRSCFATHGELGSAGQDSAGGAATSEYLGGDRAVLFRRPPERRPWLSPPSCGRCWAHTRGRRTARVWSRRSIRGRPDLPAGMSETTSPGASPVTVIESRRRPSVPPESSTAPVMVNPRPADGGPARHGFRRWRRIRRRRWPDNRSRRGCGFRRWCRGFGQLG